MSRVCAVARVCMNACDAASRCAGVTRPRETQARSSRECSSACADRAATRLWYRAKTSTDVAVSRAPASCRRLLAVATGESLIGQTEMDVREGGSTDPPLPKNSMTTEELDGVRARIRIHNARQSSVHPWPNSLDELSARYRSAV